MRRDHDYRTQQANFISDLELNIKGLKLDQTSTERDHVSDVDQDTIAGEYGSNVEHISPSACGSSDDSQTLQEIGKLDQDRTKKNWRLRVVIEACETLSPNRETRVKSMVRAFESLLSVSQYEDQNRRPAQKSNPKLDEEAKFFYRKHLISDEEHTSKQAKIQDDEKSKEMLAAARASAVQGNVTKQEYYYTRAAVFDPIGLQFASEVSRRKHNGKLPAGSRTHEANTNVSPQDQSRSGYFFEDYLTSTAQGSLSKLPSGKSQNSKPQSRLLKVPVCRPQPFKLRTEQRGQMKEQEFITRLKNMLDKEERLRVPLAQGLPRTTDEPQVLIKPPVKENTKPVDPQLNTEIRAMERADFDTFISQRLLCMEQRRLEQERLRKLAEEEEIKRMRQKMVPKAQLMPYFDRPFRPRRSSKRLTIPREPRFHMQTCRVKCITRTQNMPLRS